MSEEKMITVAKWSVWPDGRMVNELTGAVVTFEEVQAAALMGMPMNATTASAEQTHHYANKLIEFAERVKSSRAIVAMRKPLP